MLNWIIHLMYVSSAVETHSLQSLHTILSTGSPLKPLSYDYVYECIKRNVLLGSISGICINVLCVQLLYYLA